MKLGVSQSPVQSDDAVNIHSCAGHVSYATVAVSARPLTSSLPGGSCLGRARRHVDVLAFGVLRSWSYVRWRWSGRWVGGSGGVVAAVAAAGGETF